MQLAHSSKAPGWFQRLNLSSDILVSNISYTFTLVPLRRGNYSTFCAQVEAGLYELKSVVAHSLIAPSDPTLGT
jgi:hypothetical protein